MPALRHPGPGRVSLCDDCNPGWLAQPAASRAHGTVFPGIAVAVIAHALFAQFLVGGVGPSTGRVTAALPEGGGLRLSLEVANEASSAGPATCRIWDPADLGPGPAETTVRTPDVPAGRSTAFEQRVEPLGSTVRPLPVEGNR